MVTFDGIRRGRQELKDYYADRLAAIGPVTALQTQSFAESTDCLIFRAQLAREAETVQADDAFHLQDGKIHRHIAPTILQGSDYDRHRRRRDGTRWAE